MATVEDHRPRPRPAESVPAVAPEGVAFGKLQLRPEDVQEEAPAQPQAPPPQAARLRVLGHTRPEDSSTGACLVVFAATVSTACAAPNDDAAHAATPNKGPRDPDAAPVLVVGAGPGTLDKLTATLGPMRLPASVVLPSARLRHTADLERLLLRAAAIKARLAQDRQETAGQGAQDADWPEGWQRLRIYGAPDVLAAVTSLMDADTAATVEDAVEFLEMAVGQAAVLPLPNMALGWNWASAEAGATSTAGWAARVGGQQWHLVSHPCAIPVDPAAPTGGPLSPNRLRRSGAAWRSDPETAAAAAQLAYLETAATTAAASGAHADTLLQANMDALDLVSTPPAGDELLRLSAGAAPDVTGWSNFTLCDAGLQPVAALVDGPFWLPPPPQHPTKPYPYPVDEQSLALTPIAAPKADETELEQAQDQGSATYSDLPAEPPTTPAEAAKLVLALPPARRMRYLEAAALCRLLASAPLALLIGRPTIPSVPGSLVALRVSLALPGLLGFGDDPVGQQQALPPILRNRPPALMDATSSMADLPVQARDGASVASVSAASAPVVGVCSRGTLSVAGQPQGAAAFLAPDPAPREATIAAAVAAAAGAPWLACLSAPGRPLSVLIADDPSIHVASDRVSATVPSSVLPSPITATPEVVRD